MSIFKTTALLGRPLGRLICSGLVASMFYSTNALSINPLITGMSAEAQQRLENMRRKPRGPYTDAPGPVVLGEKPGRDEIGRGGIWTPRLLRDLQKARIEEKLQSPPSDRDLYASLAPLYALQSGGGGGGGGDLGGEGGGGGGGTTGTSGGGEGGSSGGATTGGSGGETTGGGGEGGGGMGGGDLNTNTGNRHVEYPVVSWGARGENGVNFEMHHNSKGTYSFDLGIGWSHSYDAKISYTSGSSAIVRFGSGLELPFTESAGVFDPPAGTHDSLVHNGDGTWTYSTKSLWALHFNTAGRLTSTVDPNGNATTITRDSSQKISSISDGTGRSLTFAYTSSGLIEEVTDPISRVWTFTYDSSNNLTDITYPMLNSALHSRTFTYDSNGNILTETDLRGKVWTFAYDVDERLTSFTNPLSQTWTWSFTTSAAILTQPNGKTVTHNYSAGKLVSAVDQAGFSESYVYDADRNITSLTDKRGKVWTATYDSNGNTLTTTNPLSQTTTYTYNSDSKVLTVTNPLSQTNTFTYDTYGNLLTSTDALSRTQATIAYNSYGEPTSVTDALSRVTTTSYDSYGNATSTTAPGSITTFASYDLLGRTTSVTDASSNTTTVTYDEWGRGVSVTEPGSATSSVVYDLESNIISGTDPLSRTGTRTLDDLGRVTTATNAKSESTSYVYSNVGTVTSITNGRGYTRTYTYSDRGEPTSLTLPDGSVEQWAYDADGNTTSYTNPLSQTILYSFNDAGWQTGVDYPTGLTDTAFGYDAAGRQTTMVDGTGTSSYTYNAAGEVTALSTPQGSVSYAYNLAGQVTSMTDVGVGTTTTSYDTAGRPSTVTDAFSDVSTYAYDSAGRLSQRNNPNGTYEQYSYDSRNRVTSIVTKNSGGTVLQSRAYTFDLASQVTQVVEGGVTTTYGYDLAGQLTNESMSSGYSASYTYDGNGNRLTRTVGGVTETYTYDNGDKLTAITGGSDPRTFSYDAAGRTTAIVRGSGTTAFAYDFESRVTSFTAPGMTTNTFTYNGLNTRVGKVDSSGSKTFKRAGVGVTAPVLSDGSANYTPSGEVRGGVKTTFHSAIKNADVQTSSAGAVTASKVYDAFGNQVSATGTWNSPFEYAGSYGYQQDGDTGLKLLGHRYYDSDTGRFLTRDIAKDGRNWYIYSASKPVGHYDSDGLRLTTLYKVVDEFGEIVKFGITYNPKRRYTKKFMDKRNYELVPIAEYSDRSHALADERILVEEFGGRGNKEPWSPYKKQGLQTSFGIVAGAEPGADEIERLHERRKKGWGVLEWIPAVGEALSAGDWLGDLAENLRGQRIRNTSAVHDHILNSP